MSESRDAVLRHRYLHPGETSDLDVYERVSRTWGTPGHHVGMLYEMMRAGRGMLNTPAIANAGRKVQMGSACYVLPINDSLTAGPSSIMQTLKDAAAVHQSGGGTGFSFGRIRGAGQLVSSTGRPAPGAVNVLRMYSQAISAITQAGMRPGANMGILPIDHPDILEFISAKKNEGEIRNFNISVAVTDEFMLKVTAGMLNHHEQFIWDSIVEGAWRNGEPGVFFIDTVNRLSLHPEWIEATNPCGEVPLRPYEACVLGSVNLASYVDLDGKGFDYGLLRQDVGTMVQALDNVIEIQDYPIPEIEREQKRYRKIGLGVMGYADALVKMGAEYGSPRALALAEEWMSNIQQFSYEASEELADVRGVYYGYQDGMPERRNLNCQVQAPTGSIARLVGCSFGIEPHFDVDEDGNYMSFILGGQFVDHNPYYNQPAFKTAKDVTVEEHVKTQAAFQKYIDQAVSKTVNAPHETTIADVEKTYIMAWETGCKGITVLREGSRDDVVIGNTTDAGVAREGDCVGASCSI